MGGAVIANWDKLSNKTQSNDPAQPSTEIAEPKPVDNDPDTLLTTNAEAASSQIIEIVEVEDFSVAFQGCASSANSIRCNSLTESNTDLWLGLRRGRVIDSFGDEYESSLITFGNEEHNNNVNKLLLNNVPIKASLKFDNVPPQVTQIKALQVSYSFQIGAEWSGMPYATEFVRFDEFSISN